MTKNEEHYLEDTRAFSTYPKSNTRKRDPEAVNYLLVALAGEVGEMLNDWKKFLRDFDDGGIPDELIAKQQDEAGDVHFYFVRLLDELGLDLGEVRQANIRKLVQRVAKQASPNSGLSPEKRQRKQRVINDLAELESNRRKDGGVKLMKCGQCWGNGEVKQYDGGGGAWHERCAVCRGKGQVKVVV